MNEFNNLGIVVEFDGELEFEDGEVIAFDPSRPGKEACLMIGWKFYEGDADIQTAMLNELGPVLVRRSLQVFANYAARIPEKDVADYAAMLRDEITVVRETSKVEQAS